jgi:catechol 2,3-dioxygenase-like lactoylglutathione lyase family enzyme
MKVTMNHVAVIADDARALADFYSNVIGLPPAMDPAIQQGDAKTPHRLKLGDHELHVVPNDEDLAKQLGGSIDKARPHFAYTVETVEQRDELIQRLSDADVKWVDWSPSGVPDKNQVFFLDPGNNLIKVQVAE